MDNGISTWLWFGYGFFVMLCLGAVGIALALREGFKNGSYMTHASQRNLHVRQIIFGLIALAFVTGMLLFFKASLDSVH